MRPKILMNFVLNMEKQQQVYELNEKLSKITELKQPNTASLLFTSTVGYMVGENG